MKKILCLAVAAAFLVSCSDDDSSSSVSETKLTSGKWYYSTTKYAASGQSITEDYEHDCATSKDFISFAAGVYTEGDHTASCNEYTYAGTYNLEGKTLTTTIDGSTDTYTVKSVSASKLVLESTYSEAGVTLKYTDTYTAN